MNILIASNEKYLKHERVMLASLRENMPQTEIAVYFMHGKLEEEAEKNFQKYVEDNLSMKMISILIQTTPFDNCNIGMHLSIETMYRLTAPIYLPNNVRRILWLDGDIVINGNLTDFYETDMNGFYVSACPGRGEIIKNNIRLNLPPEYIYFNAGVLLMNLEAMRSDHIVERFKEIVQEYGACLTWMDQDILNIAFSSGGVKYLPSEIYNCQIGSDFRLSPIKFKKFTSECCIMHFAATSKPWTVMYNHFLQRYYWRYALRDKRYGEFIKYCLIAPLKTIHLRLKWKMGMVKVGA